MATSDEYANWIVANADKKGTPEFDIVASAYADSRKNAPAQASVSAGKDLNSIPRQLGLTARYGMEGLANSAQLVTEPLRYLTDTLTPNRTGSVPKSTPLGVQATKFADWIGLPSPEGADERVVGDATRLVAGTAGTVGAGQIAQKGTKLIKAVGDMLTTAPASQLTSAAGSGLAGGSSREAGGSTIEQVLASVAGGLGGAGVASGASALANKATALKNSMMTPQQMDVKINGILAKAGVDYSAIPEKIRQSLRQELSGALKAEQELDPASVSRLLDFKRNGLTPTRGMVSLDPVQITREQNLAKIASNSSDGQLHGLPRLQNQNNAKLITNLNESGAAVGDMGAAGNMVTSSVLGRKAGLRGAEQSAWDAAKTSPGYTQPISSAPISAINEALGSEGLMPFMNPTISKYMEAFQTGQPFTPQAYRNLQSMLAREVAKGGNEGAAASLAQRVLTKSDLLPAGLESSGSALVTPRMAGDMRFADTAAADSIDAVNAARGATKRAYAYEDSSPLVRSVLSDSATSDPQRIAQRYVIGGTAREAEDLAKQIGPQGKEVIRTALVAHLKEKALNGAADEVGKFSQSTFNKELRTLKGSGKLDLFFSKSEIDQLESMGRASSYMQAQPVGSAVNNSNSGALVLGRGMDAVKGIANKIPGGQAFIVDPLQNLSISFRQQQAQRLMPGLLAPQEGAGLLSSFAGPSLAIGGLLAAPRPN